MLKPFYDAGWIAVDVFFALSGFIFFWLYSSSVTHREISGKEFALLRFSRLYPLHFVTLIVVVLLQLLFWHATGKYFVYELDSWARFVAALGMGQQWLPPSEIEVLNGPAWSVSVEVLLYLLFFWICRAGWINPRSIIALSIAGIAGIAISNLIARGIMGFFLGGAVWYASEWVKSQRNARLIARMLGWIALGGWCLVWLEDYFRWLHSCLLWSARHISPAVERLYAHEEKNVFLLLFVFTLMPLTVAALALMEQLTMQPAMKRLAKRLSFFGDISYSTYLWHFPMQLACVLAGMSFGWTAIDFMHPLAMVTFFTALIAVGSISYHFFERPLQNTLRRGFISRPAVA